VCMAPHVI
jgi:hypothetical protein